MLIRPDPPGTVFQDETVGEAKGDAVEGDEGLATGHKEKGSRLPVSRCRSKVLTGNRQLATGKGI
jgi:hypothetical protein